MPSQKQIVNLTPTTAISPDTGLLVTQDTTSNATQSVLLRDLLNPANLAAKATPVGADTLLLGDSADGVLKVKKVSLSSLASAIGIPSTRALLKAYDITAGETALPSSPSSIAISNGGPAAVFIVACASGSLQRYWMGGARVDAGSWTTGLSTPTYVFYNTAKTQVFVTERIVAGTVKKINMANGAVAATYNVSNTPEHVAVDPTNDDMYVCHFNSGNISKITAAGVVTAAWATIPTTGASFVVVDPTNTYLLVISNVTSTIYKIVLATAAVSVFSATGGGGACVQFDLSGDFVWSSQNAANTLRKYDLTGTMVQSTFIAGGKFEFDAVGNIWLCGDGAPVVYHVDAADGLMLTKTRTSTGAGTPTRLAIDKDTHTILVANDAVAEVCKIVNALVK